MADVLVIRCLQLVAAVLACPSYRPGRKGRGEASDGDGNKGTPPLATAEQVAVVCVQEGSAERRASLPGRAPSVRGSCMATLAARRSGPCAARGLVSACDCTAALLWATRLGHCAAGMRPASAAGDRLGMRCAATEWAAQQRSLTRCSDAVGRERAECRVARESARSRCRADKTALSRGAGGLGRLRTGWCAQRRRDGDCVRRWDRFWLPH